MDRALIGDKEEIELEVYINKSVVGDLNNGKEKIEDILILHLVDGQFINVDCFIVCRISTLTN